MATTPSLAMIPSGYKEEKLYSFLPMPSYSDVELVTNGTFDADSDWNVNSNWLISGSTATCDGTSNDDINQNQNIGVIGKSYAISFTIISITQGSVAVRIGGSATNYYTEAGTYTESVTATTTDRIRVSVQGNAIASIDNVSIKEVTGLNKPRLDYSDSSCPSLLLEPTRTNLIAHSEDFSNSYWTKSGSSVVSGVVSPDGSTNAFKLVESSTTAGHFLNTANMSVTSGTTYSEFIYAKKGENNRIQMAFGFDTFSDSYANFDLNLGIVVKENNCIAKIELISNGWYKCSASATCTTTGNNDVVPALINSDTATRLASYTGDGTSGLYIWGAQLEEGSYATSYIPTTDGIVKTRLQDVCNSAGDSSTFNDSEGVLFAEINALSYPVGSNNWLTITDGTSQNSVAILFESTSYVVGRIDIGGVNQAYLTKEIDYSDFTKVAFKYKQNDFALWINGVEVATDTSGNTFNANTLNSLQFSYGGGGNNWSGQCKDLRVYDVALTDLELAELTTI